MTKDFCIVVFSHADTDEKEQILFDSLSSLKKVELPIILSSHIPISFRNQQICDYLVKDNNNFIISESEIFENPCSTDKVLYNTTDYFGGCKFETFVYKKSYQPGVFNLYISSCKLAKLAGFKNILFWEYDYILGEKSLEFIKHSINSIKYNGLDSVSFLSMIGIYNKYDVLEKHIMCTYAAPNFFNVDALLSAVPDKFLENGFEYTSTSELMIMEQWFREKVTLNSMNRNEYSLNEYSTLLPDTVRGKVSSQNNYLFLNLKSGLYFDDNSCLVVFNNSSTTNITCELKIYDTENNILFDNSVSLTPYNWFYDILDVKIYDLLKSENGCIVEEIVTNDDAHQVDKFKYRINEHNFEFVSKLKKFTKI